LELQIIGFIATAGFLVHAIYLRVCYFKHDAICLKCSPHNKFFMSSVLYEYELKQAGKMVTCQASGWTYFYPRKGKRCKILICKKDYYKVAGYMLYVVHLLFGGGLLALDIAIDIMFR